MNISERSFFSLRVQIIFNEKIAFRVIRKTLSAFISGSSHIIRKLWPKTICPVQHLFWFLRQFEKQHDYIFKKRQKYPEEEMNRIGGLIIEVRGVILPNIPFCKRVFIPCRISCFFKEVKECVFSFISKQEAGSEVKHNLKDIIPSAKRHIMWGYQIAF